MVDEIKPVHPVAPRSRWPFTRRQVVAQVLVAAVILVSGIAIGIGGTILTLKDKIIWRIPSPPGPDGKRPPFGPGAIVKDWTTEYSLTSEQAQQIEETLKKQFEATRALWVEFAEKDKAEREKFVTAMQGILTPEQFSKWEPEFRERMRHFDRWRPDGFKGPGGRGKPGGRGDFDGPGGRRGDHGPRGMKGSEPPLPPDGPPPEGPLPGGPPPQ